MKSALITAVLGLSVAFPAVAQTQREKTTGSLIAIPRRAEIPEDARLSELDRGRVAMAEYARCTVDRRSAEVRRLLAMPADAVTAKMLASLADNECLMAGEMRFKPILLRGALFVELFRRREYAAVHKAAWTLPAQPFDQSAPLTSENADQAAELGMLSFAQCVVERDPVNAKAVVLASTASKAQDDAFTALTPNLGPCLTVGQKITLEKMILEGALGEVLYRGIVPSVHAASQEAK